MTKKYIFLVLEFDWLIRMLILEFNRTATAVSPFVSLRLLKFPYFSEQVSWRMPKSTIIKKNNTVCVTECSSKSILGENVLVWT